MKSPDRSPTIVASTKPPVVPHAKPVFAPTRIEDVFGCLRYAGEPKTLAEMDAGIAEEVKARHARGRY